MLGANAGPMIDHRHLMTKPRPLGGRQFDLDMFARCAVLDGVFEQVLENFVKLPPIPCRGGRPFEQGQADFNIGSTRLHHQPFADFAQQARQVDRACGPHMLVHLDARKAEQVVDQLAHALGLATHDAQEFLPRCGVAGCWAQKRVDKSQE